MMGTMNGHKYQYRASSTTVLTLLFTLILLSSSLISQCSPVNSYATDASVDRLEKVVMIHRHGDRTPLSTYPKDPYREISNWPDGWGQLTQRGKQRMYSVGRYMHRRYQGFLGKSPKEALIRSSGSDRCLQSTSLVLAGLYPPQGRWKWNNDLGTLWQPFPIQTVPHSRDPMLNPDSQCPRAKEEIDNIYASETVQKYAQSVQATLKYVEMNSGLTNLDLIRAEELFDTILIEKLDNLNLPAWIDTAVYDKLFEIMNRTFAFSALTRRIQRFRAGVLLKDFLDKVQDRKLKDKKLFVYSTHDTQLSVFLAALNVYDGLAPPFGSTIFIEFYRTPQKDIYLRLFYLKDTDSELPEELSLTDCLPAPSPSYDFTNTQKRLQIEQRKCTLSRFQTMVQDLLPTDWDAECGNSPSDSKSIYEPDVLSMYISSLTLMISLIMLMFLYLFLKNRRNMIVYKMLPIN